MAIITRQYGYSYDVACAMAKGMLGNWSRGGRNKRLADEEVTLIRYCKRRILSHDGPEQKHIISAVNSIFKTVGKKHISRLYVS